MTTKRLLQIKSFPQLPFKASKKVFNDPELFGQVLEEENTSVANVAMAFPYEAIEQLPEGTGFVVSRKGDYRITACTWTHKKWPHTTPEGNLLLRTYVGKPGDEEILHKVMTKSLILRSMI